MSVYTRLHETGTMDDIVCCPYNTSHVMGANRLQAHLIKCRKQHAEKAELIGICPYNQIHHVYKADMEKHLAICPQYHHFQRSIIPIIKARKEKEEELQRLAAMKEAETDDAGGAPEVSVSRPSSPPPPPTAEQLDYLKEWM